MTGGSIRRATAIFFSLFTCLTWADPGASPAGETATVEMFSPQGTVKGVRQVTARFSEPMVPFGDPRLAPPFDVSCPSNGKGRWADSSNWVYDFDEDLPAGIVCRFTVKTGLAAQSGRTVGGTREFSFSTGGPAILRSIPYEGADVSEDQAFILVLDAPADLSSVASRVFFTVEGIRDRVGIRILSGEARREILSTRRYAKDDPLHLVIQAAQAFPPKAKVTLVWDKGVRSASGVATEESQSVSFAAREPFTAQFSCERENEKANCIPMGQMTLAFSAPVARETLRRIALKGAGNRTYAPEISGGGGDEEAPSAAGEGSDTASVASFRGPFPEHAAFTVELPREVRDDAGRPLSNVDKFPLSVRTDGYPPLAKFPADFGILELSEGTALPVTLRNLEPAVTTRVLGVKEEEKGTAEKLKEGALEKTIRAGEAVSRILPGEVGDSLVAGLKGKLHRMQLDREGMILAWLRKVDRTGREKSVLKGVDGIREFDLPKPGGAKAFEVVGIPLKEPGFYVVEIESRVLGASLLERNILGMSRPMYVSTAVLVTNLAAHFKWGRESSLVWVTTLDKGEPVRDAHVVVRDCAGNPLWQGKTDANGLAAIRQRLPRTGANGTPGQCLYRTGLFVSAKSGNDMTFVLSDWNDGIEPWRFNLPRGEGEGDRIAHTVFDRTLLRAGETVHMKHVLRRHSTSGLFLLDPKVLPKGVQIVHSDSNDRYEFPLAWDAGNGIAETSWKIPQAAKLGEYAVCLSKNFSGKSPNRPGPPAGRTSGGEGEEGGDEEGEGDGIDYSWRRDCLSAGSFRVEEYRVPLMRGIIQPPAEPVVGASSVDVDLAVSFLSGGSAGSIPVKLRTQVQPRSVSFDVWENFAFATGPVKEGVSRSGPGGGDEEGDDGEGRELARAPVTTRELDLDRTGTRRTRIADLPKASVPADLQVEMEYRDPNGEVQTVSRRIPLWPSRILAGISPDSWASSREALRFKAAVADISGKPVPGARVRVELYRRRTASHRKRILGGFYAYEHVREVKRVGTLCEGKTDAGGLLFCEAKSPVSGNVILAVEATDAGGVAAVPARRDVWVADKDEWWFDVQDGDRIDVLPERKRYEPGETAKFQVRMPFREATALVSVEREGIIDTFVRKLSGKEPVVLIPVGNYYAPNVYVSVLCVRGRVGDPQPTALVDLGRPAFKLGVAEIHVGWKAHELAVAVSPDKSVYQVRDKAIVKIKAARAAGGAVPPKGTEVAVAAVDEGLLELLPNGSWDLLAAMMARRGYEVETATAQMHVVGRRHFGLKALPAGGGGGRQVTRELFETLLLWKGRVALDEKGEATVVIPLNDSLTAFRVAAVASGGAEFFGTGTAAFRTTQDLQILSGLPPLVREGDRFRGTVTVRNGSDRKVEAEVEGKAGGTADPEAAPENAGRKPFVLPLKGSTVALAPGEAREVGWDVTVPHGLEALTWEIQAKERGGKATDRLKATQKTVAATPVRVFQATIAQVDGTLALGVERPADALPGRGGVSVGLRDRLAGGLSGVASYMRRYPYGCLEQKTSRAVALRDAGLWKGVMEELSAHLDSDGLAKYFPKMRRGSDTLTAYILAIADEAGWEIPAGPRGDMESGLVKFVEGKIVRDQVLPAKDLAVRKIAAVEALSRRGKARPGHLVSVAIEPNLWPTSAVIDWYGVLRRVREIPGRDRRMKEAEQIVRSRLNFQGTMMAFSTEEQDYLWWLMVSGDTNALRTVLAFLEEDSWKADMPRLVRGALSRQRRGRWSTTTANAWGILAMEKFTRRFESVPVTGETAAALAGSARTIDWKKTPKGGTAFLGWPTEKAELSLSHRGTGKPWATVTSLAAIPLAEPFSSGYGIRKTVTAVDRKREGAWSRGDVLRVRLELESQADRTWVVVSDPVPAGSAILGSGLGRDSALLTQDERKGEWWAWPAFEERSFEAFRSYFEYVPKGKWTVEYTVRVNNPGTFHLPPTRVEALYSPEMFGEIPNRPFEVEP